MKSGKRIRDELLVERLFKDSESNSKQTDYDGDYDHRISHAMRAFLIEIVRGNFDCKDIKVVSHPSNESLKVANNDILCRLHDRDLIEFDSKDFPKEGTYNIPKYGEMTRIRPTEKGINVCREIIKEREGEDVNFEQYIVASAI